jgi:hypothetical protein
VRFDKRWILVLGGLLGIGAVALIFFREPLRYWVVVRVLGKTRTVQQVLEQYGHRAEERFQKPCERAGIAYPPARVYLLAFKTEKRLEVWAANTKGTYHHLATYSILAASGTAGPKRREGDRQVPEGFYQLTDLNPNSRYHLSVKVDYPNEDDKQRATAPLERLGGDIFIHGSSVSIGCLAIGNDAIEELFCLVAQVPPGYRRVLISPVDFRHKPDWQPAETPEDVKPLYERIREELFRFQI